MYHHPLFSWVWSFYYYFGGCLKIQTSEQKQHSIVRCDKGAKGHGTVVFAVVTTVPCSGCNVSEELKSLPERWNVVTICCFETAPTNYLFSDYTQLKNLMFGPGQLFLLFERIGLI